MQCIVASLPWFMHTLHILGESSMDDVEGEEEVEGDDVDWQSEDDDEFEASISGIAWSSSSHNIDTTWRAKVGIGVA